MKILKLLIILSGISQYCFSQNPTYSIFISKDDSLKLINSKVIEKIINEQTLFIYLLSEIYIKNGIKYKCFKGKNKIINEFTFSEEAKKTYNKCANRRKIAFYSFGGMYVFIVASVITFQPVFLLAVLGFDLIGIYEYFNGITYLNKAIWIYNNQLIRDTILKAER